MQLLLACGNKQSQPLKVFNNKEIQCLTQINKTLQANAGNTINEITRTGYYGQPG